VVSIFCQQGIDYQLNFYALLGCVLTESEPNYMMAAMGLINPKPVGNTTQRRDDSIYIDWQKQIDNGATYQQIAEANNLSYKTVGNNLVNWRKRNAKSNRNNRLSDGRLVRCVN